jgi:hypothetical protein
MSEHNYVGYDPEDDYPLGERPDDPRMRESVSMWISDKEGRFGFPRMCIEAAAAEWDNRGIQANIGFPDGRVLIGAGGYAPLPVKRAGGRAVTISAGPLSFEVREPLRRWTMTFDGLAYETTVGEQTHGVTDGVRKHVRIEVDAHMELPPWTSGEKAAAAGDQATASAVGTLGGRRYEQLFNCTGRFAVEGEPERPFEGTGLRIRRFGMRDTGDFPGHCWMSALFPSGRAFGLLAFPPRKDGTSAYSEAFIYVDGIKTYGKVVEAPWLTRFEPHVGPCDLVIELDTGITVRIGGRTHVSTFLSLGTPMFGDWSFTGAVGRVKLPFHQGDALYTWDGEQAYGMIERSLPVEDWET